MHRQTQRIGSDLCNHCIRTLADIHRPLMQHTYAISPQSHAHGRRVWQRCIAAAIPTTGNTNTLAENRAGFFSLFVKLFHPRHCCIPCRLQRCQTIGNTNTCLKTLAGDRRHIILQRIHLPECQPIHAQLFGKQIIGTFLGDGGLRHAKAAKCPGWRCVGMDGNA